jgi:hypothetical protein
MRPLLRPGTHLLRRGDGSLQLGLDPGTAVILPAGPGPDGLDGLDRLDGSPVPGSIRPVLDLLGGQQLVCDERVAHRTVGPVSPAARPGPSPGAAAALLRQHGDQAADLLDRRASTALDTVLFGATPPSALEPLLHGVAAELGLGVRRPSASSGPDRPARVGVLLGVGEPERELADDWLRQGVPHVVLRLTEGRAVVGPFVDPGRTACLRCVDAHHTDADPVWPLLVQQYARAVTRPRDDGLPEPVDPSLACIAVGWAARDLATFVDGGSPATWSASLTLQPDLRDVEVRHWLRHPDCGCSWWTTAA